MNKLYLIATGALLSGIITVQAQEWKPQQWPVLKKYDKEHLYQIALPLGGIGTGTVSLGGRGEPHRETGDFPRPPARCPPALLWVPLAPLWLVSISTVQRL